MQLLMSPASPFVRKVRVVIRETGQEVRETEVKTTPLATDPVLAAASPMGKIPALLRDDAPALVDSRVICRFLDERGQGGLYPEVRKWDVLTLEAIGDGISDAAVAMTYETRMRDEAHVSCAWIEAQWGKALHAMGVLEQRWMGLLSGPVNIGQISVACALGYVDLRHGARDWRAQHGSLAQWHAAFSARASMIATAPA